MKDNQFVRKGELLFKIDPSSYQLSVDTAVVQLQQARESVAALGAEVRAAESKILESNAVIVSARAMIDQQDAALNNAKLQSARAKRLAKDEAGSVADAEQWAATVLEKKAAVANAKASLSQAMAALTSSKASLDQSRANLGEPGDDKNTLNSIQNVMSITLHMSLLANELNNCREKVNALDWKKWNQNYF